VVEDEDGVVAGGDAVEKFSEKEEANEAARGDTRKRPREEHKFRTNSRRFV
jgi:hypothetical protein